MTPIDKYVQNDKLRLLLQGPSGAGKSTLACQFPKPYIIDIDVNLGGSLRFLREHKLQLPVGFDVLDKDEQGQTVPLKQQYLRLAKLLTAAQLDPNVETIVFDSGTTLAPVLTYEVCRQQGKNEVSDFKDGRQFWGFYAVLGRHFMATLAGMRKHIVLVVHEKTQTTETGATVYPIKIAWPGQIGQNLGVFFTNVWRCEVEKLAHGLEMKYRWVIRTKPDSKYELKDSLGLPPTFEFNWKMIEERLKL